MCHCLTVSLEILPRGAPQFPEGSPPTMPGRVCVCVCVCVCGRPGVEDKGGGDEES